MFATKRNTGENAGASRAGLAVANFPGVSLVLLWDWSISDSASFVADSDARGRSDVEALLVFIWMLPQLVGMQRPGGMA